MVSVVSRGRKRECKNKNQPMSHRQHCTAEWVFHKDSSSSHAQDCTSRKPLLLHSADLPQLIIFCSTKQQRESPTKQARSYFVNNHSIRRAVQQQHSYMIIKQWQQNCTHILYTTFNLHPVAQHRVLDEKTPSLHPPRAPKAGTLMRSRHLGTTAGIPAKCIPGNTERGGTELWEVITSTLGSVESKRRNFWHLSTSTTNPQNICLW